MPFADVNGARLFYTVDGDGPPMLLAHGLGTESNDWVWQIPELATRFQVIAVDLRGHGASEAPGAGYTVDDYAADLVGLLDHLGHDRAIVVGHSLSGLIVAATAISAPHRVTAVVGVDPAYGFDPAWPAGFQAIADAIEREGSQAILPGLAALEGPDTPAFLRCWHVRTELRVPPHVFVQSIRAWAVADGTVLGNDSAAYLRRRSCPVLSVYADPTRVAWEESTFTARGSRVECFSGTGHWLQQERPDEFNRLVLEWTASLED